MSSDLNGKEWRVGRSGIETKDFKEMRTSSATAGATNTEF